MKWNEDNVRLWCDRIDCDRRLRVYRIAETANVLKCTVDCIYLEQLKRLKRPCPKRNQRQMEIPSWPQAGPHRLRCQWLSDPDQHCSGLSVSSQSRLGSGIPYSLFPRPKGGTLRGEHSGSIANIQAHVTRALKKLPEEAFRGAFRAWKPRKKCINVGIEYFERF